MGLVQLKLGMSEKEVIALLGPPLESRVIGNRKVLNFAHHRETGSGQGGVPLSGVSLDIGFLDDSVTLVSMFDVDAKALCRCTIEKCPAEWLKPCKADLRKMVY